MKHLNKIFSIVLTAAIACSMLIASGVSVSAADNAWTEFKVPSKTNLVMPDNITASGFLTKGIDGALYAYAQMPDATAVSTAYLVKSTDGGRTWTAVKSPNGAITAIACSPQEANVLYVAAGGTVYKSVDSGATFTLVGIVNAGAPVTAVAVSLLGGSYKVFAGTAGNLFFFDEGVSLNNAFAAFGGLTTANVLDVKLSPTFSTDKGIFILTSNGTNAVVYASTGGPFAVTPAELTSGIPTAGEIGFSADFNMTSNPVFFVAVAGPTGGVFRVTVGAAAVNNTKLVAGIDAFTLDAVGSGVFGGALNLFVGGTLGGTSISTDAGQTWKAGEATDGTGMAFVALKSDFATSGVAFVLKAATAGAGDESGFNYSANKAAAFFQIGLLNSEIANISGTAFASNGDIFMVTTATAGTVSLWRNMGGNWERIDGAMVAGTYGKLSVSPNYATDKAVFYVASNVIQYSADNGVTFKPQSFSAGTVTAYVALDTLTFVAATPAGIMKTTNNGFVWNSMSTFNANFLQRSSDGTVLAAVDAAGNVIVSSDLGATWGATVAGTLVASDVTFQNGSNSVLWATTAAGGIFKLDLSKTTPAWSANMVVAGTLYDSPAASTLTNGVDIAAGAGASAVIYVLDVTGSLTRLLGDASMTGEVAAPTTTTVASKMFIVPAAGGNTVWAITATKLYTYKDTLAVVVPNVAVASTATNTNLGTSTANVTFGALAAATKYIAIASPGTAADKDVYTALAGNVAATVDNTAMTATFAGLAPNTTYTVSVFAIAPVVSLAGTKTFSTPPMSPGAPPILAPAAGATNISTVPGFQWGPVDGATSYTLEVSTSATFATLVGTKQTTTVPAFAWTTPALANNTTYYWRVIAITATGSSAPVIGVFTTVAAVVTTPPVTTPPITITNTTVTLTTPSAATPAYIWAIIGIGALLVIVVIVLIVRTRRVA